jgi:hypothetical protein
VQGDVFCADLCKAAGAGGSAAAAMHSSIGGQTALLTGAPFVHIKGLAHAICVSPLFCWMSARRVVLENEQSACKKCRNDTRKMLGLLQRIFS